MNLTAEQCKDIVNVLYKSGKSPAAEIRANWHSAGGRIGQYSHGIQYGSSKPRKFDMYELRSKLGHYDVIVEIKIPGVYGWNGEWINGETKYSTDIEDVPEYCTYDSGTTINIWKVPATILRKVERGMPLESRITFDQLKNLVNESKRLDEGEIIHKWRETYPGKQVVEAKEFDGLSVKEIKELIKYADNVDKLTEKIRDAAFDVKVIGRNLLEAIDDLKPFDGEEKVDGAVVDMAQNTKREFMYVCKKLQKVLANSRLPQF